MLAFGAALAAAENGSRICREGWNGKGMFVYYVPAASYPVQTGAAKEHFGENSMVPYNAYLAIKCVNETVSTWVPSINDVLAKDWCIIAGEADVKAAPVPPSPPVAEPQAMNDIVRTKTLRGKIDDCIQEARKLSPCAEVSTSVRKLQEGVMWLGMNLKRIGDASGFGKSPYPNSKDPTNEIIDKTADNLRF